MSRRGLGSEDNKKGALWGFVGAHERGKWKVCESVAVEIRNRVRYR